MSTSLAEPKIIEYCLTTLVDTLLLRPEIFAFVDEQGSLRTLDNLSEMNVPSDQ